MLVLKLFLLSNVDFLFVTCLQQLQNLYRCALRNYRSPNLGRVQMCYLTWHTHVKCILYQILELHYAKLFCFNNILNLFRLFISSTDCLHQLKIGTAIKPIICPCLDNILNPITGGAGGGGQFDPPPPVFLKYRQNRFFPKYEFNMFGKKFSSIYFFWVYFSCTFRTSRPLFTPLKPHSVFLA